MLQEDLQKLQKRAYKMFMKRSGLFLVEWAKGRIDNKKLKYFEMALRVLKKFDEDLGLNDQVTYLNQLKTSLAKNLYKPSSTEVNSIIANIAREQKKVEKQLLTS